jgi:hypothetical protein
MYINIYVREGMLNSSLFFIFVKKYEAKNCNIINTKEVVFVEFGRIQPFHNS